MFPATPRKRVPALPEAVFATLIPVPKITIVYASTAGHTEYVTDILMDSLRDAKNVSCERIRAELCVPEDLSKGDVLVLASGTWNTGGVEGQLNPYMHRLLKEQASKADLKGKGVACIALGDDRYRYTAEARVHLEEFAKAHNGRLLTDSLRIVNEPYGQEKNVREWAKGFLSAVSK